ncbi:hypothetical protein [Vibrio viridaestus]|uniref:hypothetical protein n=1 Tax=Vibrio viridaestus TaxID=2487322 RepID=UPI00140CD930|nr:hypothetical protein [Vibrio viridaestus]
MRSNFFDYCFNSHVAAAFAFGEADRLCRKPMGYGLGHGDQVGFAVVNSNQIEDTL